MAISICVSLGEDLSLATKGLVLKISLTLQQSAQISIALTTVELVLFKLIEADFVCAYGQFFFSKLALAILFVYTYQMC